MKRFFLLLTTTVTFSILSKEDIVESIPALFAENDEQPVTDPYIFENLKDKDTRKLYMQKYTEILITRRTFNSEYLIAAICEYALEGKSPKEKIIIKKAIDEAATVIDKNTNKFTAKKLNIESHELKSGRRTQKVKLNFDKKANIEHQAARNLIKYFHKAKEYAQAMWFRSKAEVNSVDLSELVDLGDGYKLR